MEELTKGASDNLYKFMAISGLAGVVATLIFPFRWLSETQKQVGDYDLERAAFTAKVDYYKRIGLYDDQELTAVKLPDANSTSQSALTPRQQIGLEIEIDRARLGEKDAALRELRVLTGVYGAALLLGLLASGIVTFLGFSLWYKKLQKHMDTQVVEEVRKQAEKKAG
jgi:hypothetical protein